MFRRGRHFDVAISATTLTRRHLRASEEIRRHGPTQCPDVGDGPLDGASLPDERVWALAIEQGCVLVTKDEDFHRLTVLRGAPPKVEWIRLGNCATVDVAQLRRRHRDDVQAFDQQNEATFSRARLSAGLLQLERHQERPAQAARPATERDQPRHGAVARSRADAAEEAK